MASPVDPTGMRHHLLSAADGRRLEVVEAGDLEGLPVLVHHGTPGSHDLASEWAADAGAQGLRLIGFSRPGYGRSDRCPGRDVAQVVGDVVTIADALGVERFAGWGNSGGGPHVLATAALLPDRVVAVACISGVAPFPAAGLDWLASMGEANAAEFTLAIRGDEALLTAQTEALREQILEATPERMAELLASLVSAEDTAILAGPLGPFLLRSMQTGLRPGPYGVVDDDLAFARPWGFDPRAIRVPTQVWQGREDLMVPFAHGRWLAGAIPAVDAHLDPSLGHLTVVARHLPQVHGWLRRQF